MQHLLGRLPSWILMLSALLLVAVVGYLDYRTGDYSLLIFYMIPISLGAWHLGYWSAIAISLAAGCARLVSDYFSYADTSVRYWNSLQDGLFLLLAGILVSTLRRLLTEERGGDK